MRPSFLGGANITLLWHAGFIPVNHSHKEEGLVTLLTKHINYMTLPELYWCRGIRYITIFVPPATSHDKVIQGDKDDGNFGTKIFQLVDLVSSQERDFYGAMIDDS